MHPTLFDVSAANSPWCHLQDCQRNGKAIRGEPIDCGECVNVPVACSVCSARGEISYTRDEARKRGVISDD